MKKIADKIVKYRKAILVIACVLLVPSIIGYANTKINYDILTYLPEELESMVGERILDEEYHSASMAMITVDGMSINQVDELKDEIDKVDGVKESLWIHDITNYIPSSMLPNEITSMLDNGEAQMILVTFNEGNGSTRTIDAIDKIERMLSENATIGGLSAIVHDLKALVNSELPIYIITAVVLCLVVLFLGIKYTYAPLIFMVGIGFAVVYNFGTNVFLGQISYITQALAAVLQLAVSMDFSIFLMGRYDEELEHHDSEEAMRNAIVLTFKSISGSSLTTIAGFLAMCTMDLTLGTDMGIVMAKGVVLGVICAVVLLPALILSFDKLIHNHTHRTFIPELKKFAKFPAKYYGVILVVALLLIFPFAKAQTKTEVYYNLIDSLPDKLPSTIGTSKLRDEFNMQTTNFILVPDDLSSTKMKETLDTIENTDGIVSMMAIDKFVGPMVNKEILPDKITDIFSAGGTKMILANSEYESALDDQNNQINELNTNLKKIDDRILVTGEGALNKDLVEIADHDISIVNIISVLLVVLIICVVFKSFTIPLFLVLAIEFAIVINMGMPYFLGQKIPFIASIVIGTIQLGATIDYAILLMTRYQEERNRGLNKKEAVIKATGTSSKSILTSGLSFFGATLGVALVSRIDLIKALCAMLSRGALISMFSILVVLPSIIMLFGTLMEKTSYKFIKEEGQKNETN